MKRKWTILGVLVASLLLAGIAVAAPSNHSIDWWVMGGGDGSGTASSSTLDGTIGQAVVGVDGSGNYVICAGFWCAPLRFSIYLPIVLKLTP